MQIGYHCRTLRRMFNLAIKWGDAKRNPVSDVDFLEEPPGRSNFLTIEQCQTLVEGCAEHLKPIVLTALNTGMRLGEILNLTWDRVHIENVIDPLSLSCVDWDITKQ